MNKIFEDEFMEYHASIISLCEELTEGRVDTIYVYCCMERCERMFIAFFSKDGKVLTAGNLKIPFAVQDEFLTLGMKDMDCIEEVCKKHGKPSPTEIKMTFDVRTRSLNTKYRYEEYLDAQNKGAEHVYREWIAEVDPTYYASSQTPKAEPPKQKSKFPFFWKK